MPRECHQQQLTLLFIQLTDLFSRHVPRSLRKRPHGPLARPSIPQNRAGERQQRRRTAFPARVSRPSTDVGSSEDGTTEVQARVKKKNPPDSEKKEYSGRFSWRARYLGRYRNIALPYLTSIRILVEIVPLRQNTMAAHIQGSSAESYRKQSDVVQRLLPSIALEFRQTLDGPERWEREAFSESS